ncbi:hypothetical protein [Aneurinibacillus tyrosinisolvens]|uniref:hypothetical protein n=1 Tax=Aneurinibacillus tyrosinisolvens TaxID=1443435 RepID=UPI00128E4528|nr:hypothetical protein [Aneurinibacillus tyrosinisolvens]
MINNEMHLSQLYHALNKKFGKRVTMVYQSFKNSYNVKQNAVFLTDGQQTNVPDTDEIAIMNMTYVIVTNDSKQGIFSLENTYQVIYTVDSDGVKEIIRLLTELLDKNPDEPEEEAIRFEIDYYLTVLHNALNKDDEDAAAESKEKLAQLWQQLLEWEML